jgi:hypothetical protein
MHLMLTELSQTQQLSAKGNVVKQVMSRKKCHILLFVMGFISGGFILAFHNAILLIVAVLIFDLVASLLITSCCFSFSLP